MTTSKFEFVVLAEKTPISRRPIFLQPVRQGTNVQGQLVRNCEMPAASQIGFNAPRSEHVVTVIPQPNSNKCIALETCGDEEMQYFSLE